MTAGRTDAQRTDAQRTDAQRTDAQRTRGGKSPWAWFLNPYVQIGVGAVAVTTSELLLKVGASRSAFVGVFGVGALASRYTWLGIVCYCLSFVSWIHVLRYVPLGIAYALINVVHVLVPIGCWLFLKETIPPERWLGVGLVLAGLLLVIKPVARAEMRLEAEL